MTAGITVYNDTTGTIQIDETYRNMLLIRSGQFTASGAATAQDLWYTTFLSTWKRTTPFAMMAVRCEYPNMVTLGPGSYRDGLKICNFNYPQNGSALIQFYIYDLVGPALSDRLGMQIFDGGANLCYSAYDYPLRIVANTELGYNPSGLVYMGSHMGLAYAATGGGYYVDIDGIDIEETWMRTWWNGLGLYASSVKYTNDLPGPELGQFGLAEQRGIIVDVRNVPLTYERP